MTKSLNEIAEGIGVYWREPENPLSKFILLFFRQYRWARRMLGGRWELVVHDKGGLSFVLSWHWVEKWSTNTNGYGEMLVGQEFYRDGFMQRFDFGDEYYSRKENE